MLSAIRVQVSTTPVPDARDVVEVQRWWLRHPVDRMTRALAERQELVPGQACVRALALFRLLVEERRGPPLWAAGATAMLFLLPPRFLTPVDMLTFAGVPAAEPFLGTMSGLGVVRLGNGGHVGLSDTALRHSAAVPQTRLRLPRPRHLLGSLGWSPGLAAAVEVEDRWGRDAIAGGSRITAWPWTRADRDDGQDGYDCHECDPGDDCCHGCDPGDGCHGCEPGDLGDGCHGCEPDDGCEAEAIDRALEAIRPTLPRSPAPEW